MNRAVGRLAMTALRLQREVDHHDGVFLNDADQHDHPDDGNHVEVHFEQHQRQERANARSQAHCWQYVKEALVASGVINSYPKTNYASEAGDELVRSYGFKRLPVHDQFAAPIGSVLVFGHGSAGHVVIRTKSGFVSDYWTKNRCKYPLVAVYGKFSS